MFSAVSAQWGLCAVKAFDTRPQYAQQGVREAALLQLITETTVAVAPRWMHTWERDQQLFVAMQLLNLSASRMLDLTHMTDGWSVGGIQVASCSSRGG